MMLCLAAWQVQAQEADGYRPLVEAGKQWTYQNSLPGLRPAKYDYYYWYSLEGDTVVAGRKCLKMYQENKGKSGKTEYAGALYEENKRVYHFPAQKESASLLYDFGCHTGDTLQTAAGTLVVAGIDTMTEVNVVRVSTLGHITVLNEDTLELARPVRRIKLHLAEDNVGAYNISWLEGVGAVKDFFGMVALDGNYNHLCQCELNGEMLYLEGQARLTEHDYQELATEGRTWNYVRHHCDGQEEYDEYYSYVVRGDTTIDGRRYKKLYRQNSTGSNRQYVCALNEVGREVFKLYPGETVWRSFYDFGNRDGESNETWVEGVGSLQRGIEDAEPEDTLLPGEYVTFLMCHDDESIYYRIDGEYRPFIEEGKVWKVGWLGSPGTHVANRLEYYYFGGDTIVDGQPCRQMMCLHLANKANAFSGGRQEGTEYRGAVCEQGMRVYYAHPDSTHLSLLYDFGAAVKDIVSVYSNLAASNFGLPSVSCYIQEKGFAFPGAYKGVYTTVAAQYTGYPSLYNIQSPYHWIEGIGSYNVPPLDNVYDHEVKGYCYQLMSCTVGDEVLYRSTDPYLQDAVSPEFADSLDIETTSSGFAKKKIDFTHVIKSQPKAPRRTAARIADNGQEAGVTGEYDSNTLSIELGDLLTTYTVSITNPGGQTVYAKQVKANTVLALNIDIAGYGSGDYTITLENYDERFTGLFNPAEITSFPAVQAPASVADGLWYDLTGRPTSAPGRGMYIRNGKKVLVK